MEGEEPPKENSDNPEQNTEKQQVFGSTDNVEGEAGQGQEVNEGEGQTAVDAASENEVKEKTDTEGKPDIEQVTEDTVPAAAEREQATEGTAPTAEGEQSTAGTNPAAEGDKETEGTAPVAEGEQTAESTAPEQAAEQADQSQPTEQTDQPQPAAEEAPKEQTEEAPAEPAVAESDKQETNEQNVDTQKADEADVADNMDANADQKPEAPAEDASSEQKESGQSDEGTTDQSEAKEEIPEGGATEEAGEASAEVAQEAVGSEQQVVAAEGEATEQTETAETSGGQTDEAAEDAGKSEQLTTEGQSQEAGEKEGEEGTPKTPKKPKTPKGVMPPPLPSLDDGDVEVAKMPEVAKPADGTDPKTRGDEDELQSLSSKIDDEEERIPDNFFYNYDEFMSKARVSEGSGLPQDILKLKHSFGFDAQKRDNLHIIDPSTIMFIAGNVVEIVDLKTKAQTYLRSTSGGGIGAIAVHPSRKYFAVCEKGDAPNILIYTWPDLKLYRVLRGGTQQQYSYADFSPDGKILASVGGEPDFMLTLWNWKQEKTLLRSKAFSQDIFRVSFSNDLEGQLTSAGTGHIRFWKMATTFTGLKLQGQLGKFGKTELTDIEGYVELPDGKVLSGAEWGNMLLWDGGLIKVEICRKDKKPCHQGPIQQIIMDEGELMTVGSDGCIRVWDFESIDTADSTDEEGRFEMEPMNELKIGHGHEVSLRCIKKSVDPDEPTIWYAQDYNGGIWKLDLSFSHTSQPPEKLLSYHSGPITGCSTSPVSHLVATIGQDKSLRVYDYVSNQSVCEVRYNMGGSTLLWAPRIIDPKGATLIAGYDDGVVRVLQLAEVDENDPARRVKGDTELLLVEVLKPHKSRVTALALDNKGEILATGGDDSSVFFIHVKDRETFEPIGFVEVPGNVTHLDWAPGSFKRNTLLVTCENGEVCELEAPEPGAFDTSHSYLIRGLKSRKYTFKSIKSRLRHEEELERKRIEEEEAKKKKEEEKRRRRERGLEDEEEEEEEEAKEEEEWHPYIPSEPNPILYAYYSGEDTFWISMDDFDAGYLYECKLLTDEEKANVPADQQSEPIRSIPVLESNDIPVDTMFFHNGKQVVMGMMDGSIRIQPLEENDIAKSSESWQLSMHDGHYGRVSHIAASFDGKHLFTVGTDGNFFVYDYMGQQELEDQVKANKAKIPSARKQELEKRVDDIADVNAYSIEDAKQKAEYDKMMRLAEEKKQGVRRTIGQLRREFKKLLIKNEELPEHLRLMRKEFEMDPEIKRELERQKEEKIALVNKELAWESEKHQIALDKLKQRFKLMVECERIVVKAFLTEHEVTSFRASKLPDDFYSLKAEMEKRKTSMYSKDESREATRDRITGQTRKSESGGGAEGETEEGAVKTALKGSLGERINKALQKVEEKKKKRALRKSQWDELYNTKPDEDYEDPADVSAIKEAQENMGDFKLKTADDYVVPDHLRMNVEKARVRLLMLKDLIHQHKYKFNQKLLSIRNAKIELIDKIKDHVSELDTLQKKLAPELRKPLPKIPRMSREEMPERKYEYTRETLLKFKAEREAEALAAKTGKGQGDGFGGFGGGGAGADQDSRQSSATTMRGKSAKSVAPSDRDLFTKLVEAESVKSPLEVQIMKAEEIRLIYRRDQLLNKIEEALKTFDAELRMLRHEKFKLGYDLKSADLRQVTLYEELALLREFEKRENVLADKVEAKQQERMDFQAKIIDIQQKLDLKKKDIEKLQEKEKALYSMFQASLGENNKFADYLTKVFKKKIKRSKKKEGEGDGSDDDSDEDSDEDEDEDWSDEDEDSEMGGYDLDVCPPGCDQTLYDNTCQLREKRLDIEEALTEEKKTNDTMRKEVETLQKKAKIIDGALKSAEADLEAFQLEKQQKINELDVVVVLKLHQIQHMVNGVLPQDLGQCLVFESHGIVQLQHRIKELEHEKTLQKKQMKEARKKHVQLIKDRKLFEAKIGEMEEQCNEMMIAKFGRIVDLEKLETVTVNRNIEELKEKLRITEIDCSKEISSWQEKIGLLKDRITDLTRENTDKLDQLNMLMGEKKEYEGSLDSRQKNLGGEFSGNRKADLHERQRLIQLVQLQAQEIEALKEEITLLSRKGGHILPPAQPPLQQGTGGL